ncbi:MAG TPA: AMP-binding protein, partial [Ktedonobacteraceae bacterium]|nr:AMP-binding protein [Ktedonobacteraceae bacterium]
MIVDFPPSALQELNFVDILTQRAQYQPEKTAYTFLHFGKELDTSLTYRDLELQVRSLAARLQRAGYQGKPVLLLYPSGLEYITAFLACLYAGVIAVPLYPPHSPRMIPRIQAIINDTQATLALTTARVQDEICRRFIDIRELQHLRWMATDTLSITGDQNWERPALKRDSVAFLQYTSGSTSTPKGVMVSHGNLLHNSKMIGAQMELSERDRGVSWLP